LYYDNQTPLLTSTQAYAEALEKRPELRPLGYMQAVYDY
jgi:hypothetical protein